MLGNTEVEYKYWTNMSIEEFQQRIRKVCSNWELHEPEHLYAVSCDDYYLNQEKDFIRHRKSNTGSELTIKKKIDENVVRTEVNINVNENSDLDASQFVRLLGYNKEFQVHKEAWIWDFEEDPNLTIGYNVDVSYYTLADGRSVIELEAHTSHTDLQCAINAINWWENELDLSTEKKEKRSLYEIFTEELDLK
jgi:adenylate cyclase class IV